MEELNNLSDAQLLVKLKEYGLPAVPVTGTTRKLLINKLTKVIASGKEPIAVNGIASEPVKKSAARRRTVPVKIVHDEAPIEEPIREVIKDSVQRPKKRERASQPQVIEHEVHIEKTMPAKPVERRQSRQSMSKSTVVTTSYKMETAPIMEDNENDNDVVLIDDSNEEDDAYGTGNYYKESAPAPKSYLRNDPARRYTDMPSFLPLPRSRESPFTSTLSTTNGTSETRNRYEAITRLTPFKAPTPVPVATTHYSEYSDENEVDDQDIVSRATRLHEFSKRLSTLRADPIGDARRGSVERTSRYSAYPLSRPTIGTSQLGTAHKKTQVISYWKIGLAVVVFLLILSFFIALIN